VSISGNGGTPVFFLGITGGIACGKSLVYNHFLKLGAEGVSADSVCRDLTKAGAPALYEIKNAFGEKFILGNGELDRAGLGELVFADPPKRERLNGIIHPKVERYILRWADKMRAASSTKLAVLEIPLLFETGVYSWLDEVLVVCAERETSLRRMQKRDGIAVEECVKRYDAQFPLEEKKRLADLVIYNDGAKAAAETEASKIYGDILKNMNLKTKV